MLDGQDLADVTLACEDRKQFQAHKVDPNASSPFFKEILSNNKHSHSHNLLKLKSNSIIFWYEVWMSEKT